MSARVLILAEGATEVEFVEKVLALHLMERGVVVAAEQLRKPGHKGGFTSYARLRSQVLDRLAGDRAQYVTTMVDLYGPLAAGGFPGFTTDPPPPREPYARVAWLERAFLDDLRAELDDARRFIPYLQLHEFEALVLARPRHLDWMYVEDRHEAAIASLEAMVAGYASPELINEGRETAPSKRLAAAIPEYDKTDAAFEVCRKTGVDALMKSCPHFGAWVERLAALPPR